MMMPHRSLTSDLEEILDRCEQQFRRIAGERIFVTGGTGFVGRWLLEALRFADKRLSLGLKVVVLSRDPEAFAQIDPSLAASPTFTWWRGDVRDFLQPSGSFSLIIHAATPASERFNREQPLAMFDTIVGGTRHVLEFASKAGANACLLTSSGAVYGRQPSTLAHVDEAYGGGPDPTSPVSAYAEGKRAAEFLAAVSGVPVKIARGFAFVGPYLPLDAHFAAGNFIRDVVAGRPIEIRGDGTPLRSYLYAADLVAWLLVILLDGAPNRPYNVGSDKSVSIKELANTVAEVAGGAEVIIRQPPSGAPAERYVPSVTRARSELGLEVWTPLAEAFRRSITWARADNSPALGSRST